MLKPSAVAFVFILLAGALHAEEPDRVVGLGVFECEYWHARVSRQAVNHRAMLKEPTIYPYTSYDEWEGDKDGKEAFAEASNWLSGYFSAAQRFSNRPPKNKTETTDKIVLRVFELCGANPHKSFEWASFEAVKEFLK